MNDECYPYAEWHLRPTRPGKWVFVSENGQYGDIVLLLNQDDIDRGAPFHAKAVYGPLPELSLIEAEDE